MASTIINPGITSFHICLDNQAAITAASRNPVAQPGQTIIMEIQNAAEQLRERCPRTQITLTWIPDHEGIAGNEKADLIAKRAANSGRNICGSTANPPPTSLAATQEEIRKFFKKHSTPEEANKGQLHRQNRGQRSSKETFEILSSLPRSACSIIVQLRSGHVALRGYLANHRAIDSPTCNVCNTEETVLHYLTTCRRYTAQRDRMRTALAWRT